MSETQVCQNCKRDVPAQNLIMHENFCTRNNVLCEQCGEVIKISEKEQHAALHEMVACGDCGKSVESQQLAEHRATVCPVVCGDCGESVESQRLAEHQATVCPVVCECGQTVPKSEIALHKEYQCERRSISCPYCNLPVPGDEMVAHESSCGSRTEQCPLCKRFIQNRDLSMHYETGCQYPVVEPPPQPQQPMSSDPLMESGFPGMPEGFASFSSSFSFSTSDPSMPPQVHQSHTMSRAAVHDIHNDNDDDDDAVQCPLCQAYCPNFEEFQVHQLTQCPKREGASAEDTSDCVPQSPTTHTPMLDVTTDEVPLVFGGSIRSGDAASQTSLRTTTHMPIDPTPDLPPVTDPALQESSGMDRAVPCEICGSLVPFSLFVDHQAVCGIEDIV